MTKWDDPQSDMPKGKNGYRPFRRKAALRAEIQHDGVADPVAPLTLAPETPEQLPMTLPETWERLQRLPFSLDRDRSKRVPLVNLFRADPAAKAIDVLRTRILQTLKARGWRRIGIASPTRGCGTTFTATNLALSLARIPESRTVLLDLNMRDPGVADVLGLRAGGDMRAFLRGDVPLDAHLIRCSDSLAIGLTDRPVGDAAELLHARATGAILDVMEAELTPDAVLCDLPPVLASDDLTAFLPQLDAVLLVADGTCTTSDQIRRCEQVIGEQAPLLGVVLNRGRGNGLENYAI